MVFLIGFPGENYTTWVALTYMTLFWEKIYLRYVVLYLNQSIIFDFIFIRE